MQHKRQLAKNGLDWTQTALITLGQVDGKDRSLSKTENMNINSKRFHAATDSLSCIPQKNRLQDPYGTRDTYGFTTVKRYPRLTQSLRILKANVPFNKGGGGNPAILSPNSYRATQPAEKNGPRLVESRHISSP
jgi:hypothetical protein